MDALEGPLPLDLFRLNSAQKPQQRGRGPKGKTEHLSSHTRNPLKDTQLFITVIRVGKLEGRF